MHYECPGCGQYPCTCPEVKSEAEPTRWLISKRLDILSTEVVPWMHRMDAKLYDTEALARQALPAEICKALELEEKQHKMRMRMMGKRLIIADDEIPKTRKGPAIMEPIKLSPRHEEIKVAVLRVKYGKKK